MADYQDRILHLTGTPYEAGLAAARELGPRLEATIQHYITSMEDSSDMGKLHAGALPWLRRLPVRFQEELHGLAEGANVPLERLAEWSYIEECEKKLCSGAVCSLNNHVWVARNNDTYVPELWGYVTIHEVTGRIPSISFSMEGDVFTPTGINQERLWLHYNFLPVWDAPATGKPHLPAFVFLTEALEVCRDISDVEAFLRDTDRDSGMLLFAVDCKTGEFALFDCLCSRHYRRDPKEGWIVGTNHYCTCEDPTLGDDEGSVSTLNRFQRVETLVRALSTRSAAEELPADLIRILADEGVERRGQKLSTAYANVACPETGEIWYTFGGYPAASKGNWGKLEWPWGEPPSQNHINHDYSPKGYGHPVRA